MKKTDELRKIEKKMKNHLKIEMRFFIIASVRQGRTTEVVVCPCLISLTGGRMAYERSVRKDFGSEVEVVS